MKKTSFFLTAIALLTLFGMNIISEAQEMDRTLDAKQQAIVPIAALPKLDPETALRMEHEEKEVKQLRKENARLKMEVEILKKATAYFAREIK